MSKPARHDIGTTSDVIPLSMLKPGQSAMIEGIDGTCADHLNHRLHMLGFGHGRHITKMRQAPFGGPMMFQICDVQMCLRHAQAEMILVRRLPEAAVETAGIGPQLAPALA